MTRQDQIYKWFVYALGLLPLWLADAYLLGRWLPVGTRPLLLLLSVVTVAVMEGATAGAGFGFGVGMLWVFGYPNVHGGMIFFLPNITDTPESPVSAHIERQFPPTSR